MSRSVEITGWCDGRKPAKTHSAFYTPGELKPCGKSLSARSHKKLTEKIERVGWKELPDGTLKCTDCQAREARGERIEFSAKDQVKNGSE